MQKEEKSSNLKLKSQMLSGFLAKFILLGSMVFVIILIILMFVAHQNIIVTEFVTGQDISDSFKITIPYFRLIFEPFIGILQLLERADTNTYIGILIFYLIFRLILLIIDHFIYKNRLLKNEKVQRIFNIINFGFWISALWNLPIIISIYLDRGNFNWINYAGSLNRIREFIYLSPFIVIVILIIISIIFIHFNLFSTLRNKWKKIGSKIEEKTSLSAIKVTFRELITLISFIGLIFFSVMYYKSTPVPLYSYAENKQPNELLIDFHVHTTESDGSLTPQERIQFYLQFGLNGAAITDHNSVEGSIIAEKYVQLNNLDFTVILGEEYTAGHIHMNFFGINETILPSEMNVSDAIKYVKNNNGYVIVNHYDAPEDAYYSYEDLRDWGVDGFEIFSDDGPIRQFCLDNNLICFATTDKHANDPIQRLMRIQLNDANNRSLDAIFDAMKNNQYESIGIDYVEPSIPSFVPNLFEEYIQYFLTLTISQIISWIAWILLISTGFLILINKNRSISVKTIKK